MTSPEVLSLKCLLIFSDRGKNKTIPLVIGQGPGNKGATFSQLRDIISIVDHYDVPWIENKQAIKYEAWVKSKYIGLRKEVVKSKRLKMGLLMRT